VLVFQFIADVLKVRLKMATFCPIEDYKRSYKLLGKIAFIAILFSFIYYSRRQKSPFSGEPIIKTVGFFSLTKTSSSRKLKAPNTSQLHEKNETN
jgi:hypothetical protein